MTNEELVENLKLLAKSIEEGPANMKVYLHIKMTTPITRRDDKFGFTTQNNVTEFSASTQGKASE